METRTTRSARKRLNEHSEGLVPNPRNNRFLSEAAILTPPPSQSSAFGSTPRRSRGTKRDHHEDHLDQPPPTPTYSGRKKTRYGDEVPQSSSSLEPSCSSSGLDAPMNPYHTDDITLEFGVDFWQGVGVSGGLVSENDPYLPGDADNSSTKGERGDLHTPTPSLSPRDDYEVVGRADMSPPHDIATSTMPKTPMPRPGTPDYNPLASAMDTPMVIPSLDHDDDENDSSSLVAGSTLSTYGPPPTPMCPPRVGNLSSSSSSSTTSLLQLSSAIRNTTSTSAAPPLNILASDDDDNDDDEDVLLVQNNKINSDSNKMRMSPTHNTIQSNLTTPSNNLTNEDSLDLSKSSRASSTSPPPLSPTSGGRASKHSHRLRIRAPPYAHSGHKRSDNKKDSKTTKSSRATSHSIKSILKISNSKKATNSESPSTSSNRKNLTANYNNSRKGSNEQSTSIKTGEDLLLMPPPKPKPAASVPSSMAESVTSSSNQNGALPFSEWTTTCLPEISKNLGTARRVRDGNIIYLKLINFMTHINKEWKFKEGGLKFIVGENGSGKSGMQLGMKVLMGDKAKDTMRATSMKNLITEGRTHSDIEGHFTNYNGTVSKEVYGEVIKLKRRIKSSGSSTYWIFESGRWKIIKLYEMARICYSLNLDPNNPFQFLQQDRFKDSSKPGSNQQSKRDFDKFKQATRLTAIEEMLEASKLNLKGAERAVKEKKEMRHFYALQEKQAKEALDQIEKMESSENRIAELETELKWSEVQMMKNEEKRVQAEKAKVWAQLTQLREEKEKLEDGISNFSSMEEKNKKLIQDLKWRIKQLESEKEGKVQELRKVKQTQQRAHSQHSTLLAEIRRLNEEIEKHNRELKTETISYEAENEKHRAEIEKLQGRLEEVQVKLNDLRSNRDKILAEKNECKATERKGMSQISQLDSQLKETKRELTKKDNYGRHMNELQAMIEKYKGWTKKPIGPLGQYIQVRDAKFAPLVEYILYHALFTFVVQTKEDFATLKGMIEVVYNDKEKDKCSKLRDPTITQIPSTNNQEYKAKLGKVMDKMSNFRTVLGMLTIKDEEKEDGLLVLRTFVDKTNCERIVLFEDNQTAATVMKDNKNFPSELIAAYTLEGFKVSPYPRYGFQLLPGKIKPTTDIIPMAKGETIVKIKEETARKREVVETCKTHLKSLDKLLRQNDAEIQEMNKLINKLKNTIKHTESCIREESTHDQHVDVVDQIKMVEEMRASREKEIEVPLQELKLATEKTAKIRGEIEKIEEQFPELKKNLEELEGDHNGTNRTVAKLTKEIQEYKTKINRLERDFTSLGDAETKIYFEKEDLEKNASQLGPCPLDLSRDSETVLRELENTKQFLDKNKDKLKSKRRVVTEYNNSKALVLQFTKEIDIIEYFCLIFQPLIKVNTDFYEREKKEMSRQLTQIYRTLVEAHKLTGDLIVDWQNGTLMYYVCPDQNAEKKAKQSYSNKDGETVVADKQGVFNYVQNLSGGERSKALVFFIMAMWKITSMPIHVLDEFETCLDHESRRDIHDKIIQHAVQHPEEQFFIITPLDLPPGFEEFRKLVEIIRLRKRNWNPPSSTQSEVRPAKMRRTNYSRGSTLVSDDSD